MDENENSCERAFRWDGSIFPTSQVAFGLTFSSLIHFSTFLTFPTTSILIHFSTQRFEGIFYTKVGN
jgi:hypothetical protein